MEVGPTNGGNSTQPSLVQEELSAHFRYIKKREAVESKFNKYSYYPGISTISGFTRATVAAIYTLASLILFAGSKIAGFFTPKKSEYKQLREVQADHWKNEARSGFNNIGYGFVEAIPFVGNILMLPNEQQVAIDLALKEIGRYVLWQIANEARKYFR